MKKALLGMLIIMMLVISGCGDGSVSVVVEPPIEPPTITSLEFTKDPVDEFIDGSVSFFAPDSDIDTITVVVFGNGISRSETTPINRGGIIEGTIPFSINYSTFPSAFGYTLRVYVTDLNGLSSNEVERAFDIP